MRSRLTWSFCLPFCLLMSASASLVACVAERHLVGDTSDAGAGGSGASVKGGGGPVGQAATGGTGVVATGGDGGPLMGTGGVAASSGRGGRGAGSGSGSTGGVSGGSGIGGTSVVVVGPGTGGPAIATTPRPLPMGARKAITAVSRLLWQSAPDASLLAMADSGAVSTTEDVRKLALRMLIDARAQVGVGDFYRWWLNLDDVAALGGWKDPMLFPGFNADLATAMASETQMFGTSVTLDGDGLFSTLLTAPFTFVNQALAGIYKLDGVTGTALRRVALDPTERAGLLTQSGLLAMNATPSRTSVVKRGLFWEDKLLCSTPPPPPPNVPLLLTPAPAVATMRQLLEAHRSNPACSACHLLMDPLGDTLEHFDAIGQFRTTENGLPIDTSAVITFGSSGRAVAVEGAPMVATLLASAPEARACMVRQWVAYAVNRPLTDQDNAALVDVQGAFSASGFNLRDLIAAVTQTDLFLTRAPTCTPGLDATCNDDPTVNSLRGHCNEGLRCVCPLFSLNPDTGRCY